ncbi:MAG: hypothetical protein MR937_01345 [Spirochaetia bacterium]|nr:hypothetical protein [Spirochaetia bacterium]
MKKILFLFLISFAFLSCSNNNQTADISFSFSRNTLEEPDIATETETESKLNISCKITGPSVNQVKSQKITTQKEVFFSFEEIPVDTSVIVEVNVVDTKNIRLYSGRQTLTIKQGDNPVTVNLVQIQDGANLSIDGIQGIQFKFDKTEVSEDGATVEIISFSTTELEKGITATTTILPEENKEITNNLKYFYYLNGEKLEGNSNTITIFPTDPLEQDLNHLLVIVQYDNLSNPVYYSASLEFFVTEVQE